MFMKRPRLRFCLNLTTLLLVSFYVIFAADTAWSMVAEFADPRATVMSTSQELAQSDYTRFWYVGRHFLAQAGLATPPDRAMFALDIFSPSTAPGRIWLYPPMMALAAMPFAAANLTCSYWLWRAVSLVGGAWLLRRAGLGWAPLVAGLGSPAALCDMAGGQNGTMLGSILVVSLLLAERRPWLGGALAGALCVKPQMGLILPASWLRLSLWRAVAAATGVIMALAGLSWLVEGRGAWFQYITVSYPTATIVDNLPFRVFFPVEGITPLDMLRSLHMPLHLAWAGQVAISLMAFVLAWLAWRPGCMAVVPRMALCTCLSVLAMPYGFSYDLVAFSLGMAALFFRAGEWERLLLGFLWLTSGYTIILADDTGLLLFPLWAACGAAMAWRLRAS